MVFPMKTKAAILYKHNSPLIIQEIEIPKLKKGQVLVKMLASGICRSQLNEIRGLKGNDQYLPHLLGHEGFGIVEEIGKEVTKVKAGDHVVITWIKGEGLDGGAVQYKFKDKTINSGPVAAFCEDAVISENRLVRVIQKIPYDTAALLGCAVLTGAGLVRHHSPSDSSTLAVFGTGGIGGGAILGAKMKGYKKIIAIDINKSALQFAKKIGATETILFAEKTIGEKIRALCPEGLDFAVEASGNKQAMEKAYQAIKNNGLLVIAGNLKKGETISIDPFGLICQKKIIGSWGGESNPDRDIPFYIKSFREGIFPFNQLLTRRFQLKQVNEALKILSDNQSQGRMIIDFTTYNK